MRIINDLHLGSTYELKWIDYQAVLKLLDSNQPTIWLGDIIDMKNCKKSEVPIWLGRLKYLSHEASTRPNHKWITGNHELNQITGDEFVIVDDTYYTHGDLGLLWTREKGEAYRSKTPGAGWFKRYIISPFINEARELIDAKIGDLATQYIKDVKAKYPQVKRVVCGHKHPDLKITQTILGVELVVLPRGVNYV